MPQATVKTYDPQTRDTVVMFDDLTEADVPGQAVQDSGLLELRIGQRIRFEQDGDQVTNLDIVSM